MFSFYFIIVCGLVAIFAYALAPDNSSNANQMHLEIHSKKPGFKVLMLTIPSETKEHQSWFNKILYGNKNQATEIPISKFNITKDQLIIKTYVEDTT